MRTVLLVGTEAREFTGILRLCREVRRLPLPVQFARSGLLNGTKLLMVAHGPGRLALEALAAALRNGRPDAVVSTGFCGALDPAFETGDIFVAERVAEYTTSRPASPRSFRCGLLVTSDRVVARVEEKRRLRAAGASAVEMEAAGVARRAFEEGLPFYCVRAVLDRADEDFFVDFERMRDAEGRFSRALILRAALASPRRSVPELVRLDRQGRRAARALGEFIADCRF